MSDPIDRDPLIFTGVEATPEDVLAMLADPDIPITPEAVPLLPPEQQPTPEQIEAVIEASGDCGG